MTILREFRRAVLPTIALSLLSAVFSGEADSVQRDRLYRIAGQNGIAGLSSLPHLDAVFAYSAKPAIVPAFRQPRPEDVARFTPIIEQAARANGLDPLLLHAVIRAESGYNANALSARGAAGLMQLVPVTGKRYGVRDLFDPRDNIRGGARYLRDLLELFENNLELALAGYNAGEGSVIRAGNRIPSYRETLAYVPKVLDYYRVARNTDAWP